MQLAEIHDAICAALVRAGGIRYDTLVHDANESRADVFFANSNTIVEVKSLTSDRNKTKSVREKSGHIMQYSAKHEGGPIIFGDVAVPLSQLPRVTAEKLLMNLGQRLTHQSHRRIMARSPKRNRRATCQRDKRFAARFYVYLHRR